MKIIKTNQTKLEAVGVLEVVDGVIDLTYMDKQSKEQKTETLTIEDIGTTFEGKEVKIPIVTQDKTEE